MGITCLLMILCCSITYGFIAWLIPQTYGNDLDDALKQNVEALIEKLEDAPVKDCGKLFDEFRRNNDVLLQLFDASDYELEVPSKENSNVTTKISGVAVENSSPVAYRATHSYLISFADLDEVYTLTVAGSARAVNQLMSTLGDMIPLLFVLIVIISTIGAMFYSRYVTKPVIEISNVSEKMSKLDFTWNCTETRTDQLGVLAHSLNGLSQKLSSALSELKNANMQLQADIEHEKKLEQAQLDFFSAVSHELKTPITIIKGQLEGMLLNIGRYQDRDQYLSRSLEVTNRLESMVQEILVVSRIKSSGMSLHQEALNFSDMAKKEYGIFEDIIAKKQLNWQEEIEAGLVVQGDKLWLTKVLNNLVSNAIHYSPKGQDVVLIVRRNNGEIQFMIENTGVHISDSDLPKLFDAFYRVEQSRNRQTGGSGLGLYIVKMILDQHQAKYYMENTSAGVKFSIHFKA